MQNDPFGPLREIGPGISEGNVKPHKFALLMAITDLYDRNSEQQNCFHISTLLEDLFEKRFRELASDAPYLPSMIETPFFHLQSDSIWFLTVKEGKEADYEDILINKNGRFTKKRLLDVFDHASLTEELHSLFCEKDGRIRARKILEETYRALSLNKAPNSLARICPNPEPRATENPFVTYLNSLQRSGGSNENALAESQACNSQFASIHVVHPLADIIHDELSGAKGTHVILTGHAGDGKSTVALEVYKRLKGLPTEAPLVSPPKPREDVEAISIIKDLSERDKSQDGALIDEFKSREKRFLVVSNTGALLDLIKKNAGHFGTDPISLESKVLDAISTESGEGELTLGTVEFRVFNLARMDNLGLAQRIFEKMLAPDRWSACAGLPCRSTCPIYTNVSLIQCNQNRVLERLFLAYRRMYEYGTRLTMRQLTEHLAYMITSGLNENDIRALQQCHPRPLVAEYMFYNRFFGDNGCKPDAAAFEMKAVEEIARQGFGTRPCPGWEHRLWLRTEHAQVALGIDSLEDEFEKLRRHGARSATVEGMTPDQARQQVRRMLFFLYDFPSQQKSYLGQYVNSPTLLDWLSWQQPGVQLGFNDKTTLEQKIYHVLQEHFTGVRLPEGSTQNDRRLYVTLSRRRSEVRQSAQVVLAQVDWSTSTVLKLVSVKSASGEIRKELVLRGKERIEGIDLVLKVPFLDYVMLRHFGELGEILEASYMERLEKFKAQVHARASTADENGIMLVRLKTDHTFRRQYFSVNDDRLEVTDVL